MGALIYPLPSTLILDVIQCITISIHQEMIDTSTFYLRTSYLSTILTDVKIWREEIGIEMFVYLAGRKNCI